MAKMLAIPYANLGQCPPYWKCASQGLDAFTTLPSGNVAMDEYLYPSHHRPPVELVSLAAKRPSADPGDLVEYVHRHACVLVCTKHEWIGVSQDPTPYDFPVRACSSQRDRPLNTVTKLRVSRTQACLCLSPYYFYPLVQTGLSCAPSPAADWLVRSTI